MAARQNTELLIEQARQFSPRWVVATDSDAAGDADWSRLPADTDRCCGEEAIQQLVSEPEVDTVMSAIAGAAGLNGTWAALNAGKKVALANKETMVECLWCNF